MKKDGWLLKAILAEALSIKDIPFLRDLFATETSDKRIRLQLVERMIANSEGMRDYIRDEKIKTIMTILGNEIHWDLVFAVTRKNVEQKMAIAGWNEKQRLIAKKKSEGLRKKFLTDLGRRRFNSPGEFSIDEGMAVLEQAAGEVLDEIENGK